MSGNTRSSRSARSEAFCDSPTAAATATHSPSLSAANFASITDSLFRSADVGRSDEVAVPKWAESAIAPRDRYESALARSRSPRARPTEVELAWHHPRYQPKHAP